MTIFLFCCIYALCAVILLYIVRSTSPDLSLVLVHLRKMLPNLDIIEC